MFTSSAVHANYAFDPYSLRMSIRTLLLLIYYVYANRIERLVLLSSKQIYQTKKNTSVNVYGNSRLTAAHSTETDKFNVLSNKKKKIL